jgi:hypothetical protein
MAIHLTRKESNLVESVIKNYGQVSFEYDALMEIISENRQRKNCLGNSVGPKVRKPKGPIKSRPSKDGHSEQRLI